MHLYMGEWLMYLYMRERRVHSVRHEYGWVKSQMWCVSQMWVSHVSEMWVRHASAMWVSHVYSGWYLTVGDIFAIADDITHCEMRVRHVSVMWVSHVYSGWYLSFNVSASCIQWVSHVYSGWYLNEASAIADVRVTSHMWVRASFTLCRMNVGGRCCMCAWYRRCEWVISTVSLQWVMSMGLAVRYVSFMGHTSTWLTLDATHSTVSHVDATRYMYDSLTNIVLGATLLHTYIHICTYIYIYIYMCVYINMCMGWQRLLGSSKL